MNFSASLLQIILRVLKPRLSWFDYSSSSSMKFSSFSVGLESSNFLSSSISQLRPIQQKAVLSFKSRSSEALFKICSKNSLRISFISGGLFRKSFTIDVSSICLISIYPWSSSQLIRFSIRYGASSIFSPNSPKIQISAILACWSFIYSTDYQIESPISLNWSGYFLRIFWNAIMVMLVMYSFYIAIKVESCLVIGLAIYWTLSAISPKVSIDFLASSESTSVTYSPSSLRISPILFSLARQDTILSFVNLMYVGSSAFTQKYL